MDPRERWEDREEAMRVALEGWQKKMWTATPGIVQAQADGVVDSDGCISVVPAIKAKILNAQGVATDTELPMLIKCPLQQFGGGGFSITAPIAAGDEVLIVFASRCIDGWWQSGGVQGQIELRMHNLSDGFAIPGFRNKTRALSGYSETSIQLRSDDGLLYIELTSGHIANIVAPGGLNITGPVNITGDVNTTGTIEASGDIIASGDISVTNHLHGLVQRGTDDTGPPLP